MGACDVQVVSRILALSVMGSPQAGLSRHLPGARRASGAACPICSARRFVGVALQQATLAQAAHRFLERRRGLHFYDNPGPAFPCEFERLFDIRLAGEKRQVIGAPCGIVKVHVADQLGVRPYESTVGTPRSRVMVRIPCKPAPGMAGEEEFERLTDKGA